MRGCSGVAGLSDRQRVFVYHVVVDVEVVSEQVSVYVRGHISAWLDQPLDLC